MSVFYNSEAEIWDLVKRLTCILIGYKKKVNLKKKNKLWLMGYCPNILNLNLPNQDNLPFDVS